MKKIIQKNKISIKILNRSDKDRSEKNIKPNNQKGKNKIPAWIYWTPRILSMVFILFLMLFSLDIFEMKLGFWGTIVGLFMHNIPAFILIIILVISWRREIVGGITFILAGLAYIVTLLLSQNFEWFMLSWSIIISGPAFFIGILFLIGWRKKRKEKLH